MTAVGHRFEITFRFALRDHITKSVHLAAQNRSPARSSSTPGP